MTVSSATTLTNVLNQVSVPTIRFVQTPQARTYVLVSLDLPVHPVHAMMRMNVSLVVTHVAMQLAKIQLAALNVNVWKDMKWMMHPEHVSMSTNVWIMHVIQMLIAPTRPALMHVPARADTRAMAYCA